MASSSTAQARAKDTIPEVLNDPTTGKRYLRGRFLGKVKARQSDGRSLNHCH